MAVDHSQTVQATHPATLMLIGFRHPRPQTAADPNAKPVRAKGYFI